MFTIQRFRKVTPFALVLLLVFTKSSAQVERESLKSVKSMRVVIETLRPELEEIGLSTEVLNAQMELKLRSAGIEISPYAQEWLYLNINSIYINKIKSFVYNISLNFNQHARLIRTNEYLLGATTWNKGTTGLILAEDATDEITKNVSNLMDIFVNDFLAANPKKR